MADSTFHKVSWDQLYRDCLELAKKIEGTKVDRIVSITRGGLVPARILSDFLKLPISHITITSYEDMKQVKEPQFIEGLVGDYKGKDILLVDEVSDSGKTFKIALDYLKKQGVAKIVTAAPYIKSKTTHTPDFFVKNIDAWIVFPYDLTETYDAFLKQTGSKDAALKKLREVGFVDWEMEKLTS